jgi:hypothetical protein
MHQRPLGAMSEPEGAKGIDRRRWLSLQCMVAADAEGMFSTQVLENKKGCEIAALFICFNGMEKQSVLKPVGNARRTCFVGPAGKETVVNPAAIRRLVDRCGAFVTPKAGIDDAESLHIE